MVQPLLHFKGLVKHKKRDGILKGSFNQKKRDVAIETILKTLSAELFKIVQCLRKTKASSMPA
jgi:hypothetical protein